MACRDGARLAAAAAALAGVPFRLHGRDPAGGLDCVGVIGAALAAIGRGGRLPTGYGLRMRSTDGIDAAVARLGLRAATDAVSVGDVLLFRVGPAQVHFAVADGAGGIVHAHAGLRRVVCGVADPRWVVRGHWRLED